MRKQHTILTVLLTVSMASGVFAAAIDDPRHVPARDSRSESGDMIAAGSPFARPDPGYITSAARLLAEDCLVLPSFAAHSGRLQRSWNRPDTPVAPQESVKRWRFLTKSAASRAAIARSPAPARARQLIPQLKAVFTSEGIPPELVWVAEVESRFDPDAASSAGARGLFQFMPETAERFGLVSRGDDRRSEPEFSARAAARYLGMLYEKFGSWALALAAYNTGEGRIERLLNKHNANTFDEIAEFLPNETRLYVPKVMATLAAREKVKLGSLPAPALTPTWN